jgi:hypothetical protein
MGYAIIALAIVGFGVGMTFRLKVLLMILILLLAASIIFSLGTGFSFLHASLTIMAVQTVVQGSYFLGLLARSALTGARGAV